MTLTMITIIMIMRMIKVSLVSLNEPYKRLTFNLDDYYNNNDGNDNNIDLGSGEFESA